MEIGFFKQKSPGEKNMFIDALSQYHNDLEEGNYRTLTDYTQEAFSWTTRDELDFLETTLKPYVLKLALPGITLANIRAKLEIDGSMGMPRIVDLLTSISLLKNKEAGVISLEKQADLHEMLIEAAIPSASFVCLATLRDDKVDVRIKLSSLSNIIDDIKDNIDDFGASARLVCCTAIIDWLQVYPILNADVQARFLANKNRYNDLLAVCLEREKANTSTNLVEQCTLMCLKSVVGELTMIDIATPKSAVSNNYHSPRL